MKKLLILAAIGEGLTGVILLVYPPIVIRLLFGEEITGAGVLMSRIAGICLIALGVACWPDSNTRRAFSGMLTYSTLAMLYLVCVGVRGEAVGFLLWPAVVVHAILVVLLVGARFKERRASAG